MIRILAVLALLAWSGGVRADTPCPTLSDGVSILSVNVVNAPLPVIVATYDIETGYLSLSFSDGTSRLFVGVPLGLVQDFQTQWSSILSYPHAYMQVRGVCPLLTVNGLPILTQ